MFPYVPLLVKLSEEDKRVLIAVAIFLILLFILVGVFAKFINKYMKSAGRQVDNYTHDLVNYKIITNPHQFRRYMIPVEIRHFYLANRIPIRILLLTVLLVYAYFGTFENGRFDLIIQALQRLTIEFEPWPTTVLFGFEIASDWPATLIRTYPTPVLELYGYVTYIGALISLGVVYSLFINTLRFIGRMRRGLFLSHELFLKTFNV